MCRGVLLRTKSYCTNGDALNKVTARGHVSCAVRSKNNNGLSNLFAYTIAGSCRPPTRAGNSSSDDTGRHERRRERDRVREDRKWRGTAAGVALTESKGQPFITLIPLRNTSSADAERSKRIYFSGAESLSLSAEIQTPTEIPLKKLHHGLDNNGFTGNAGNLG